MLLMFIDHIGVGIKNARNNAEELKAVILAKAAQIVRRDMFDDTIVGFNGSFDPNCQENSVPQKLKALVNMVLKGSIITQQNMNECNTASLTISQLMWYNSVNLPRIVKHQITITWVQ